jgi:predicted esterase
VPDEGEAALAGLGLAGALGFIGGAERASLDALLRREYAALAASPRFAGLPAAPLVRAAGHARYLQWIPPGRDRAPCLVFLHGFGGQLTVYLRSLIESGLGDDFVVLAPFFEASGRWWSAEGEAIVRDLVERRLPAAADPGQVYLVGLSNGAIGAARLLQRPGLRGLFRGGVLLSGSAAPAAAELRGLELLILAGSDDPRFPIEGVRRDAAELEARGAEVALEALPADHFLILSHAPALAASVRAWAARER